MRKEPTMKHYLLRSSLLSALVCTLLVAGLLGVIVPTLAAPRQTTTAPLQTTSVLPLGGGAKVGDGGSISGDSISGDSISGDSISGDSISGD